MITLTQAASEELRKILSQNIEKDQSEIFLRVGVKGGGCRGLNYTMDIVDEKDDEDQEFESQEIKIVVDPKSILYLDGTEIDFKNTLIEKGFVFNNPNHNHCGCGQSFCPSEYNCSENQELEEN